MLPETRYAFVTVAHSQAGIASALCSRILAQSVPSGCASDLHLHAATANTLASSLACDVLVCAGERIAFEVDGPHHFTANTLAATGEMLARQKLLRARGWAVISVPFFRWAGRADEARARWLLQVQHLCIQAFSHSVMAGEG